MAIIHTFGVITIMKVQIRKSNENPCFCFSRFTSVGSAAIYRFLRPICLQNYPKELLPGPLQDSNPLQLWRLINGARTRATL